MKDIAKWHCHLQLKKFYEGELFEILEREGNLLLNAGILAIWTALTSEISPLFNNTNTFFAVGDSTVAETVTQTDLQATINKTRIGMLAGFPKVGLAGGLSSDNEIQFSSQVGAGIAEWNTGWQEWGIANAAYNQTLLNRKVDNLGIKGVNQVWIPTVTIAIY